MIRRAYAFLHVKDLSDEERTITGVATTPEPDRLGDIVEPLGVTYKNPLPLLLYHDAAKPVGTVRFKTPTPDGIAFVAQLPVIAELGTLRDRVEEAWQSIKAGLLAGVSIGFRAIEEVWNKETQGFRFLKTEVLELSLVAIPAHPQATIHTIKALDQAAFGHHMPGDTGTLPVVRADKGARTMPETITEQIKSFENTRAAKAARMVALMTDAQTAGATLDTAQTEEYDGLSAEVKSVDAHLVRLRDLEKLNAAAAVPVPSTTAVPLVTPVTRDIPIITVKATVPAGTGFTRYCQALLATKGNLALAERYAERWDSTTPEVRDVLKAAVAAGTTTDATWAGPLAPLKPLANEFLALLRPATLLGNIPNLRKVPFNVSVPAQTGGGTYKWVGQGAPKPVGSLAFSTITLGIMKVAGIIVITDELARNSTPDAEAIIRADMIAGIAQFLDTEFTDPTKAPVANVSPGSITNGVTAITSAGTTPANARTDIQALINAMTAANISVTGAVLIMSQTNAAALASSLNALGQPLFPALNVTGGTAMGIQVVASQSAGNNVILVAPQSILYADDGGVTIDVSTEASLQMDSAPAAAPDATTVFTSLWQMNQVGLRAERYITWKRARTGCVQYTVQGYIA